MKPTKCDELELQRQLRENKISTEMAAHLTECDSCREHAESLKLVVALNTTTLAIPHSNLSAAAILWRHQINLLAKRRQRNARISLIATTLSAAFAVMMFAFVVLGSQAGGTDNTPFHLPLIVAACAVLTYLIVSPIRANATNGR